MEPERRSEEPFSGRGKGRVLVIDDDPAVLMLARIILTHKGFLVREAADPALGLALAQQSSFEAFVIDLMMPTMSGYDIIAELAKHEGTAQIPIIVLTAKTALEDQIRAWREGAWDFLMKPFPPEQLVGSVQRVIGMDLAARDRRRSIALRGLASQG